MRERAKEKIEFGMKWYTVFRGEEGIRRIIYILNGITEITFLK